MKEKRKVMLYPPTLDYAGHLFQTPQQIARMFADNGYDVIFCNMTQRNLPAEEVEPHIYVYHNFADVLNRVKHKRIKVDVFYYTWAKSVQYLDQIKAKINIYNRVDVFPDWLPFEEEAIQKAHLIFTTSELIYNDTRKDKPVYLIRNACPTNYIYNSAPVPEEYKNINKPIVAIVGAIGSWVHTGLIRKVAEKYHTVLVGTEFGKDCPKNVHKLGIKNHEDLLGYYEHANITLIPFNLKSGITHASCPLKMYESMAAGTIAVATEWGETSLYPDVVYTGRTDEEFLSQVDRAIDMSLLKREEIRKKAKQIAMQNTWEQRFSIMQTAIEDYCKENGVLIG